MAMELVERLRTWPLKSKKLRDAAIPAKTPRELMLEAADEIERLKGGNK